VSKVIVSRVMRASEESKRNPQESNRDGEGEQRKQQLSRRGCQNKNTTNTGTSARRIRMRVDSNGHVEYPHAFKDNSDLRP